MLRKLILLLSLILFANNSTCAMATDDDIRVAFLSSYIPREDLCKKYPKAMTFEEAETFLRSQDSNRLKKILNEEYSKWGSAIHFLASRPPTVSSINNCIVKRDYSRIFKILRAKDFDFNLCNSDYETPLLLAVSCGNSNNVDNILKCGADASLIIGGTCALIVALELSSSKRDEPIFLDIVDKLLDYGVYLDVMNSQNEVPITLIKSSIFFNTELLGELNDKLKKREPNCVLGVVIEDFADLKKNHHILEARGIRLTALLNRMEKIKLQQESVALVNCATVISVLR